MMNNSTVAATAPMNIFETTSRKLEQFLFLHDILPQSWYKAADGMTVWVYPDNEEVKEVVAEYQRILARREMKRRVC